MNRRTGLGRCRRLEDAAGDPLDGLVNLFDIGIVLAVAFLVAGLGVALNGKAHPPQTRTSTPRDIETLPPPSPDAPAASGHGQPVGTVYRLGNGQLVYVHKQR
jgi:hypothetical protein